MFKLNDGRTQLYQWDKGRTLTVTGECTQVHFANGYGGSSIDVDVVGGKAAIPDVLLQSYKDLICWAYIETEDGGYTTGKQSFKVNRRPKPEDYDGESGSGPEPVPELSIDAEGNASISGLTVDEAGNATISNLTVDSDGNGTIGG